MRALRLTVGGACYLLDQTTKHWARHALTPLHSVPFVPGFLKLSLVTNTGAAFSLGSGHAILMTFVALAVTGALIVWVLKEEKKAQSGKIWISLGAGFLVAGALGNLTDRFVRGRVTDFLEFDFIQFPVFNVADICIDIGVGLLLINACMSKSGAKQSESGSTEVAAN